MTEKRIEKIKEILKQNEAALIMSDINRLYLTSFKSSAGAVLITKNSAFFLIDFRYFEKAKQSVKHLKVNLAQKLYCQINEILKEENIDELIIETDKTTLNQYNSFKKNFSVSVSQSSVLSDTLATMRQIKTKEEIELIKKAQAITDEGFKHILSFIELGKTEKEIALELEFFMRKKGSEDVAFDFIAVSGKNSSLPHGVPTDKKIEKGDFLTLDFGAVAGGYRSDMTRTVAVGEVSCYQREIYEIVLKAQTEALKAIKPDASCFEIDKIARDIIGNAGYSDNFGHGLGHSLGLEIHENPACNTRDKIHLRPNMLMTVEPGIYLENQFGVRIEDLVLVTEKGCENLTHSPKELIIL